MALGRNTCRTKYAKIAAVLLALYLIAILLFIDLTHTFIELPNNTTLNLVLQLNRTSNKTLKIISFSVFGTNKCYQFGALENALIAQKLFSDWKVYLYVEQTILSSNIELINIFKSLENVKLIIMNDTVNNNMNYRSMLWRYKPAFISDDNNNNIVIIRDTDDRLDMRDKLAVNEWLNSTKDFHVIRDHAGHKWEIMGGMWGSRNNILLPLESKFNELYHKSDNISAGMSWFGDQLFMCEIVYPYVMNQTTAYIHDTKCIRRPKTKFCWKTGKETKHNIVSNCSHCGYIGESVCDDFRNVNRIYGFNLTRFNQQKNHA